MIALLLVSSGVCFSQFKVQILLKDFPAKHAGDSIFVAGNFNAWEPGKEKYRFLKNGQQTILQINGLDSGIHQFKFTRGNWQTVECLPDGSDIGNRQINISSDTSFEYSVEAWKDDFAPVGKQHTASDRVRVLDTAFYIPQLKRHRRIWIYLPPGYSKSKKRYPVLYMQDGQNIFDEYTAGFGEWGVDECLDSLIRKGKNPGIVVGIDNGPRRLNEYNPYDFKSFGKGEGDKYVDFIANTLKPYIDKHYRTLPSKQNSIIAGSSMGGLISYYAMLKYPETFGKAGIFSPAFWTAEEIKALTASNASYLKGKLFFYMGGQEGDKYIDEMKEVTDELGRSSPALVYAVVDPDGSHNEEAWRKWFPEFYTWIMADGFNYVIKVE